MTGSIPLRKTLWMRKIEELERDRWRASSYQSDYITFTETVSENEVIALPTGMEYTPGKHNMFVNLNGAMLIVGHDYTETDSTHITTLSEIRPGLTMQFVILDTIQTSQTQRLTDLEQQFSELLSWARQHGYGS